MSTSIYRLLWHSMDVMINGTIAAPRGKWEQWGNLLLRSHIISWIRYLYFKVRVYASVIYTYMRARIHVYAIDVSINVTTYTRTGMILQINEKKKKREHKVKTRHCNLTSALSSTRQSHKSNDKEESSRSVCLHDDEWAQSIDRWCVSVMIN